VSAPPVLEETTAHQPRARAALSAALSAGPSHAYLFRGPRGSGKRAVARAFAAEILAASAPDPAETRRRALLDPSPHPDLVWLAPSGTQHLVGEIRERVIRAAAYRPFEGGKRVFVVEAAEAMRDESQNALLKTLEDPPEFVHVVLLSSEPEMLLETVSSRCQAVNFVAPPPEAVEEALAEQGTVEEIAAAARLSGGNAELARFLLSEGGKRLRAESLELVRGVERDSTDRAAVEGSSTAPPIDRTPVWKRLLEGAESVGADAEAASREALEEEKAAGVKRTAREIADEAKRTGRRRRTEMLDLGLGLCSAWFRDLIAAGSGATETVFHRDYLCELEAEASGLEPARARRAAELVEDTRRRLDLNVSEELALEALTFRLERLFS
jgi:DNA polymerase III subunit delta'